MSDTDEFVRKRRLVSLFCNVLIRTVWPDRDLRLAGCLLKFLQQEAAHLGHARITEVQVPYRLAQAW